MIALMTLAFLAVIVFLLKFAGYGLTYQVSTSMPKGFYFIKPAPSELKQNMKVVFSPPTRVQRMLLKHHWVPQSGLLMKYVMARPGDHVCYYSNSLWVNGRRLVPIYHFYAPGKSLPSYHFCGTLSADNYLLISHQDDHSFDSRYFGPINRKAIIGEAIAVMDI